MNPSTPTLALALLAAAGLAASAAPGAAQERAAERAWASLTVRVVDRLSGDPVADAAVTLRPDSGADRSSELTDSGGRTGFFRVPPGRYAIVIERIGYAVLRDSVAVAARAEVRVAAELVPAAVRLDPIVVTSTTRRPSILAGFHERRELGIGTHVTRGEIEALHLSFITDLFWRIPGVRVVPGRDGTGGELRMRGGCRPAIFVDGVRLADVGMGLDDLFAVGDVEAVEVYRGVEVPVRFGAGHCGAVVVWTRVPERVPGQGSLWKRVAAAVFLVAGAFLLTR